MTMQCKLIIYSNQAKRSGYYLSMCQMFLGVWCLGWNIPLLIVPPMLKSNTRIGFTNYSDISRQSTRSEARWVPTSRNKRKLPNDRYKQATGHVHSRHSGMCLEHEAQKIYQGQRTKKCLVGTQNPSRIVIGQSNGTSPGREKKINKRDKLRKHFGGKYSQLNLYLENENNVRQLSTQPSKIQEYRHNLQALQAQVNGQK